MELPQSDVMCAVLESEDLAVVRVRGRGTFQNSVPLKRFADLLQSQQRPKRFIVDLGECETLDSTFMGVLASISLAQTKANRQRVLVAHANDHVKKLLKTLGLTHLLDLHEGDNANKAIQKAESEMKPADASPITRLDQLLHTLEAHKTLVKLDDENELRFQSVIHYLEQSLQNAEDGIEGPSV